MANVNTANSAANAKATAKALEAIAASYEAPTATTSKPDASEVAAKALYEAQEAPASAPTASESDTALLAQFLALAAKLGFNPQAPASAANAPLIRAANPAAIAPQAPKAFAGGNIPLGATIDQIAANPKKPGSAAHFRYSLYPSAPTTVGAALKAGVSRADVLYDIRAGFITLG